jgi:hypothetical protein
VYEPLPGLERAGARDVPDDLLDLPLTGEQVFV